MKRRSWVALSLLAACARPSAKAPTPLGLGYDVVASDGGRTLTIEARLPRGTPEELSVDHLCEPFVRDVEVDGAPLAARGTSWFAPRCRDGCTVRYRYLLGEAARTIDDLDRAEARGATLLAPPSTWLLRPISPDARGTFELGVRTPAGLTFESGLRPSGPGRYRASLADLPGAPYSGFGAWRTRTVRIDRGEVVLSITGEYTLSDREIERWVERAGRMVAAHYGAFPTPRVWIGVVPAEGAGLFGRTLGNGGASIVLDWGRETTLAARDDDWIVVHELIHLALPSLPLRHRWLEEGLSTYVEPLVRLRGGVISREALWRDLWRGLPNGLPEPGDRGLDETPTWGRTYWGGALFCLHADLALRERTAGKSSLQDALRAIVDAGGDVSQRWSIDEVLAVGDKATGATVLRDTYDAWAHAPVDVDLPRLFAELGVVVRGERVTFDDAAPRAHLRRQLEAP